MTKFNVELDVINSGSPNDLANDFSAAKGAASECYLNFGGQTITSFMLRVGEYQNNNFVNCNIKNGGTYKNFVNLTNRNCNTNSIEIPVDDPSLIVSFSIYYGIRQFDSFVMSSIQTALAIQISPLVTGVVGNLPAIIQQFVAKDLSADLTNKLDIAFKNQKISTVCTGIGQVVGNANPLVIPIYSVVDLENTYPDQPIISKGDLVANLILTPQL